jgi:hypothetical protein
MHACQAGHRDDVVTAAMIDRLVHHAEVINLKGDSYCLKDRNLGRVPAATTDEQYQQESVSAVVASSLRVHRVVNSLDWDVEFRPARSSFW